MNKDTQKQQKPIIDRLKERKVQDFSYAILFFARFVIFLLFFVIRPVLAIAVALRREGQDLERINKVYEDNIAKVLQLQADLEHVRPKSYLLNEALPENPKVDVLIGDVRKAAAEENITLEAVAIAGLQLKGTAEGKKEETAQNGVVRGVKIDITIAGSYEDAVRFVQAIARQRRIKTIESVEIAKDVVKDPKATGSASPAAVKLKMNVQAYYL
ncbi:MAG: Pilus assembly protein, PilO [Microgenomates bacterium OLB23]|nr:MAG: Pilus assembly protein, PilO [Microgenomates bacterium OLB23]